MACITKLANAIAYDCDTGATGLVSAIIINKADIASFTVDSANNAVTAITLAQGAKAYRIDTVKRSLVVSSTLKVNEGAPNAYTHSASLTITRAADSTCRALQAALTNGSFVVLAARPGVAGAYVYGLYYGLYATASESSSHDNGGWTTATLETPENVIGEDNILAIATVYDALYTAALS
jgi:hypothetical protein